MAMSGRYNLRYGRGGSAQSSDAASVVTGDNSNLAPAAQYYQEVTTFVEALVDKVNERFGTAGVPIHMKNSDLDALKGAMHNIIVAIHQDAKQGEATSQAEMNDLGQVCVTLEAELIKEKARREAAENELASHKQLTQEAIDQGKMQFRALEDSRACLQAQVESLQKSLADSDARHLIDADKMQKLDRQLAALKAKNDSEQQFHGRLLDKIAAMGHREYASMQALEEYREDGYCHVQPSSDFPGLFVNMAEHPLSSPHTPK